MEGGGEELPALLGEAYRLKPRGLEIIAVLDQPGAKGTHGGVLLAALAVGNDDGDGNTEARAGKGQGLAVIAARGGNDAVVGGAGLGEAPHVDQAAAHLEGACRGVVFVLDPDIGAQSLTEYRPLVLRCAGKHRVYLALRVFQLGQGEQIRASLGDERPLYRSA
jgi:hypothetical protein